MAIKGEIQISDEQLLPGMFRFEGKVFYDAEDGSLTKLVRNRRGDLSLGGERFSLSKPSRKDITAINERNRVSRLG